MDWKYYHLQRKTLKCYYFLFIYNILFYLFIIYFIISVFFYIFIYLLIIISNLYYYHPVLFITCIHIQIVYI